MRPCISPLYDVYNCLYYNMSFNSNCRIVAAERKYTFNYEIIYAALFKYYQCPQKISARGQECIKLKNTFLVLVGW